MVNRLVCRRTLLTKSLTYRIETNFDQYEDTTVRRPVGKIEQDFSTRLRGLIFDLITY